MSVAAEFPPVVDIPESARGGRGARRTHLRVIAAGTQAPVRVESGIAPSRPTSAPRARASVRASAPQMLVVPAPRGARPHSAGTATVRRDQFEGAAVFEEISPATRCRPTVSPASRRAGSPAVVTRQARAAQPAAARASELRRHGLRLTRRGVVVVAALVVLVGAAMLGLAAVSSAGAPARPSLPATVMVQPGDTLWSIASGLEPDRDPRVVVDDLMSLNHLRTASLTPGQTLKLK